jgi:ribulose 1,5-bisphosphate carboxylase large subunit-like protein
MSSEIEIIYSNFKLKEGCDAGEVKKLMARDASWGTFNENLYAAEQCCGNEAKERWMKAEPVISNLEEQRFTDKLFSLTFSADNFNLETEGINHFISTIAGDILRNSLIDRIDVDDFNFKGSLYDYFPGPNVGVDGLYKDIFKSKLSGKERPLIAFTIKPRMGLNIEDFRSLFIKAAEGGIDIIEDDERLIDSTFCPFKKRVDEVCKIQDKYEAIYSVNITGTLDDAIKRLDYAASKGIKMVKFDVLASDFETLRRITLHIRQEYSSKIAITVYPDAYGNYRRLSRKFILKMSRLCGADIIYAGSPTLARYEQEAGPLRDALEPIYNMHTLLSKNLNNEPKIKSSLPTITNDQYPSIAEIITVSFRKYYKNHFKYAFFVGGGISGFLGSLEKACDVWMKCIDEASSCSVDKYDDSNFGSFLLDQQNINDYYKMKTLLWKKLNKEVNIYDSIKDENQRAGTKQACISLKSGEYLLLNTTISKLISKGEEIEFPIVETQTKDFFLIKYNIDNIKLIILELEKA